MLPAIRFEGVELKEKAVKKQKLRGAALVLKHLSDTGRMGPLLKEAQNAESTQVTRPDLNSVKRHLADLAQRSLAGQCEAASSTSPVQVPMQRICVEHVHRMVYEHHLFEHSVPPPTMVCPIAPFGRWVAPARCDDPNVIEMDQTAADGSSWPPLLTI